jgi:hypothetical protein
MKEKQICWTGSQSEYDDPVSLSQFLILFMFHFSVRRQQNPGANILAQSKSVLSPTYDRFSSSKNICDIVKII